MARNLFILLSLCNEIHFILRWKLVYTSIWLIEFHRFQPQVSNTISNFNGRDFSLPNVPRSKPAIAKENKIKTNSSHFSKPWIWTISKRTLLIRSAISFFRPSDKGFGNYKNNSKFTLNSIRICFLLWNRKPIHNTCERFCHRVSSLICVSII